MYHCITCTINHSIFCFRGLANDAALDSILDSKGKHQQDLISDLLADERYQREAFTAMYVKEDERHKEICTQVEQIQAELANLTVIEMTKKDLKASSVPSSKIDVASLNNF